MEIGYISLKVDKSEFGVVLRIRKDKREIVLSLPQWHKLLSVIYTATNENFSLKLYNEKRIERKLFEGRVFVSFIKTCKQKQTGEKFNIYINFSEENWAVLINKWARNITHLLNVTAYNGMAVRTYPTPACTTCFDVKIPLNITERNRPKLTNLCQEKYEEVRKGNEEVENQLGVFCEYCGISCYMLADDCHCHEFNCKECSPFNFCENCDKLIVAPAPQD